MKKQTIRLVLALLMVFSLLPVSAFAANTVQSGKCGDNLTWTLDDAGVLTITGTGGMTSNPWSDYKDSIKSVIVGNGVTVICNYAFADCSSLESVELPDSLERIGGSAFSHCKALTEIVVPANVKALGEFSFYFCTGLKKAVILGSIEYIDGYTFDQCYALESVSIPKSVKSIWTSAFGACHELKEVYFGGTAWQWAAMSIDDFNDVLDNVTVYCALEYPFSDIADSGYREYISLGQAAGIINGYPDGTYRPNNPVTRAQYVTMLYNMCGKPDASGYEVSFNDTNTISASYMDAVKWGVAMGVINGYGDNTFRPNKDISRAEMAAFSYRLIKLIVGGEPTDELKADCSFKDSASIPNVHREAVNVCANLGIIQGFSDGNFRPNSTANRGQAATILVRVAASLGSDE